MTQGADPSPDANPALSCYERLGITAEASFDAVQAARQQCLDAVGEDPQARARIEAAYDAVLMDRLKERQQGKVSSAALNASQREAAGPAAAAAALRPSLATLPRPSLPVARLPLPSLGLAEGPQRWWPLAGAAVLLVALLLAPPSSSELVLAFATLLSVVQLQRRNGRLLVATGWSLALLITGLLLGAGLLSLLDPALPLGLPLAPPQVQSLPALLLLALGALLIG